MADTSTIGTDFSTLGAMQTLGVCDEIIYNILGAIGASVSHGQTRIPPHTPLDPDGVLPGTLKVSEPGPINQK